MSRINKPRPRRLRRLRWLGFADPAGFINRRFEVVIEQSLFLEQKLRSAFELRAPLRENLHALVQGRFDRRAGADFADAPAMTYHDCPIPKRFCRGAC